MSDRPTTDRPTTGRKNDASKPRPDLIPPWAEAELIHVLTHGADLYGDENWMDVIDAPDGIRRYLNAALRHIGAYRRGQQWDPDTNRHHLAHAVASLMFIINQEVRVANTDTPR